MSKPTTDHEHYCAITQAFIDDLDADPIGIEDHDHTHAPSGLAGAHQGQLNPAGAALDDTSGIDDDGTDNGGQPSTRRRTDETPIDLDSPPPANQPSSTHGTDTADPNSCCDETSSPRGDLADQLTSTTTPDDTTNTGGAGKSKAAHGHNKSIAVGFAAATMVATLLVSGALLAMRSHPHTNDQSHPTAPNTRLSVVAAPSTSTPMPDNQDATIPYTATSVGCLPGSTAAQSVAGPDSTQAWVCVTGGNLGQYLELNLGRSMLITAVSITPGWVGADASGTDQWHQHRVLTRVQWSFNDTPPTVVPQDTGSVHGDVTKPLPTRGVLASRIILLIQETGRAPADLTPTSGPAPGGEGLLGEVLGPPAAPADPAPTTTITPPPGLPGDTSHTDPADNSFAVSSIKIFGHPPQ